MGVSVSTSTPSDSGFTLIEGLIVVAFLTVLAAFAVPSVRVAQEGYRVHTTAFNVAQKLSEARTDALKRNRQTWLLVDGINRTAQVQTNGATGPINIGFPEQLPQGVSFVGVSSTLQIFYDTVGRPATPPVTLQLTTTNGMTRTITVVATGRVTVTQP